MRNRAKCRLCNGILESFHFYDHVSCKCGEISISGGLEEYQTASKDPEYKNFIRVDDEGNEIVVKVVEKDQEIKEADIPKLTKKDYIDMLDALAKNIENLPSHAMQAPITHYDYCSLVLLLSAILRAD